jgi:hypothetical protein
LAAVDKGEDMRKVTGGEGEGEGVDDVKGVDNRKEDEREVVEKEVAGKLEGKKGVGNKGEVVGTQKVADRKVVEGMWVVVIDRVLVSELLSGGFFVCYLWLKYFRCRYIFNMSNLGLFFYA